MASFNDLPIELLHRIIDLSVEDAIAVYDRKLRRQILLRLALVSKKFTLPSQAALWRYIYNDLSLQWTFFNPSELWNSKVILELQASLWTTSSQTLTQNLYDLQNLLRKVNRVESIILGFLTAHYHGPPVIDDTGTSVPDLDSFFEVLSLKELKSLQLRLQRPIISTGIIDLPSLRHLSISGFSSSMNDELFSKIIESCSNTLVELELLISNFQDFTTSRTGNSTERIAAKLMHLKLDEKDSQVALRLLPLCTSLKSLHIISNSFESNLIQLQSISPLIILQSLTIGRATLIHYFSRREGNPALSCATFTSFLLALESPQLNQLKFIYFDLGSGRYLPKISRLKEVMVRKNFNFFENLEWKGIKLGIGTGRRMGIKAEEEREKQRLFKERQDKLDLEKRTMMLDSDV